MTKCEVFSLNISLQVALITLCNIFLNVSLQDSDAVGQADVFAEVYGLVANVLPKLSKSKLD